MQIFYTPDIAANPELPEEEAGHCIRVLRLTEGDEILLTDGKGVFYKAAISRAHHKHCEVSILESWQQPALWNFRLHIAVAPTKIWIGWNGLQRKRPRSVLMPLPA